MNRLRIHYALTTSLLCPLFDAEQHLPHHHKGAGLGDDKPENPCSCQRPTNASTGDQACVLRINRVQTECPACITKVGIMTNQEQRPVWLDGLHRDADPRTQWDLVANFKMLNSGMIRLAPLISSPIRFSIQS